MILSAEEAIRAARLALAEHVLPSLDTADWPASTLRASLMLLAYAEDCIRLERPRLRRNVAAMATFFDGVSADSAATWLDDDVRAAVAAGAQRLSTAAASSADAALAELIEAERDGRALMSRLVLAAAEARARAPGPHQDLLRTKMRATLSVLRESDAALTAQSRTMLPI